MSKTERAQVSGDIRTFRKAKHPCILELQDVVAEPEVMRIDSFKFKIQYFEHVLGVCAPSYLENSTLCPRTLSEYQSGLYNHVYNVSQGYQENVELVDLWSFILLTLLSRLFTEFAFVSRVIRGNLDINSEEGS